MKYLTFLICVLLALTEMSGQSNIAFQHLNTSNGLSYIGVDNMSVDRQGNLWISTGNGLNMFNGRTVEKYFDSEHPQLRNSNVLQVACDKDDRVWVLTANGNMTIIDEERKFHRLGIYEDGKFIRTRWILKSKQGSLMLFTTKGHYILKPDVDLTNLDSVTMQELTPYPITDFTLLQKGFRQVFYYDDDTYLFVLEDLMYEVDYTNQTLSNTHHIAHCTALTKWGENGLIVYDRIEKKVKLIELSTLNTTYPFDPLRDQLGMPVEGTFMFAEMISPTRCLFTTEDNGIYIYNTETRQVFHHTHRVGDESSVVNNNTSSIQVGPEGWIFIACRPSGISYFNCNDIIGDQNTFIDDQGRGYDGLVVGIATKDNNIYYIGTTDGVLEWTRTTNRTRFLDYTDKNGQSLTNNEYIASIVMDSLDQVWVTTNTKGILVLDKNRKLRKQLTNNHDGKYHMKLARSNNMSLGPDGYVWACGRNGICRINPVTLEVDNFENHTLAQFDSVVSSPIVFTDKDKLWIAASTGVFKYSLSTDSLVHYTTKDGLIQNAAYCIGVDKSNNTYIGTPRGLNIISPNGRIKTLTRKNGLLMDRAEGFLLDEHNRMWIGNDIGLACYTPADSTLVTFDTRHGLSVYGFRVGSYFKTPNGEFTFGTPRGIQFFYPDSLYQKTVSLTTLINRVETKDITASLSKSQTFYLSPDDRQVIFYFNSVDYSPHVRTYYEYKLSGVDADWVRIVDQNSVRYNSLPHGEFVFNIRVSNDNQHWQDAQNAVTIHIATPFYKQLWFRLSVGALAIGLIWFIVTRTRKKQHQERELLETEVVIHYFASQINRHKDVHEMLWDVAKNCISKLNLEECVIYLLDKERNMLVQTAAYGPKNPKEQTIYQPIEIPAGQGITGHVVISKKPEIVNSTDKDPRYIVDDEQRLSEIAVPVLIDGEVIAVIDSEHPRRNFFTQKHLSLMTTISILTGNQMQRIQAEEEKQKAEIEVLKNQQKVTESRLQSLRLQMNPHFLFNALNSIQQMILSNEEMVATRYLSRFSKLLRTILIHSDKELVTLKEELEILRLYVDLEAVRFKDAFRYNIDCDEEIDIDEVKIPTLLIQPFVENAIWHGLMHKDSDRHLTISFNENGDSLECVIEDNGIGRAKAQEMKLTSGHGKDHTSKGIAVSVERLKSMNGSNGHGGSMQIIDLKDQHGVASGTRVEIRVPIQP